MKYFLNFFFTKKPNRTSEKLWVLSFLTIFLVDILFFIKISKAKFIVNQIKDAANGSAKKGFINSEVRVDNSLELSKNLLSIDIHPYLDNL